MIIKFPLLNIIYLKITHKKMFVKIFQCSPRSLMRWVEQYELEGEIQRKNIKSIAYKLHKEEVDCILQERNLICE